MVSPAWNQFGKPLLGTVDPATDAKRQVQVLERRGAGVDHPALFGLHETEYLKCYCLRVLT